VQDGALALVRLGRFDEAADWAAKAAARPNAHVHVLAIGAHCLALAGRVDPQEKRQAVGETFLSVRESWLAAQSLDPTQWLLGQGTLYPDIIESGGKPPRIAIGQAADQ